MSIQIHPTALKVAAKLSGHVKDITSNTKHYTWSNLHRLVVRDNWLFFYTNDGQVFLEWLIPLESHSDDNYEVIVPAVQFNELASKALAGLPYYINYQDGLLELSQGKRKLKIRPEAVHVYPDPRSVKPGDPTWLIAASLLHKNLRFVAPFIDENNAKTSMKVATWTKGGDLVGGTLQLMVRVQGLPVPRVPMNFTQKAAKALSAFLGALEGDVQVTVSEKHYNFECPTCYHRLLIARETASFREPQVQVGAETEIFKIDRSNLLSGVSVLVSLLPNDAHSLLLEIQGSQDSALVKISTSLEDSKSSQDEIPVIRETILMNGSPLPVTQFFVNSKFLAQALREMNGVSLTVKYYHRDKLLYIEDECCNNTDTRRVAMLVVNSIVAIQKKESRESREQVLVI